jgi:hypothetical protein
MNGCQTFCSGPVRVCDMCEDERCCAKRPRLAYNKYETISHTHNLVAIGRALAAAASYGIVSLKGESLPSKFGLGVYDDRHSGPQPHGEGYTCDIDDAKFFEEYEISESERRFLATSADVIKLLGEDLCKAHDLDAETCAAEIVSLIEKLREARLNCMKESHCNFNLESRSLFDKLPGWHWTQAPSNNISEYYTTSP